MSAAVMNKDEAREHYDNGGALYEMNAAGTIGHRRIGWAGSGSRCGKVGTGPYAELPPGARKCKACAKAHNKARAEQLIGARRDALSAGIRVQAKREKCHKCYGARPHSDAECTDTPARGDWVAFRELVKEAPTPRDVWTAYEMFVSDDKESV